MKTTLESFEHEYKARNSVQLFKEGQQVIYKFAKDKEPKKYPILSVDPPASIPVYTYELKQYKTKGQLVRKYASQDCLLDYNAQEEASC